jgi:hypothetical protein
MPGTYNRLVDTLQNTQRQERVWAIDYSRTVNGKSYPGKKFIVCEARQMYQKMLMYGKPSTYEVITQEDYVKLYLDCEFDLAEVHALTAENVIGIVSFLTQCLDQHLRLSFPELNFESSDALVLHSCTPHKMSIHII